MQWLGGSFLCCMRSAYPGMHARFSIVLSIGLRAMSNMSPSSPCLSILGPYVEGLCLWEYAERVIWRNEQIGDQNVTPQQNGLRPQH